MAALTVDALNTAFAPLLKAVNEQATANKCDLLVQLELLNQKIDALTALCGTKGAKTTKTKATDAPADGGAAAPAAAAGPADPAVHADVKLPTNKRQWFLNRAKVEGVAFLVQYSSQAIVDAAIADPSNLTKKTDASKNNNGATLVYDVIKANPTGPYMKRIDAEFAALKTADAKGAAGADVRAVVEPHGARAPTQ